MLDSLQSLQSQRKKRSQQRIDLNIQVLQYDHTFTELEELLHLTEDVGIE
jgi:hypothetical protein